MRRVWGECAVLLAPLSNMSDESFDPADLDSASSYEDNDKIPRKRGRPSKISTVAPFPKRMRGRPRKPIYSETRCSFFIFNVVVPNQLKLEEIPTEISGQNMITDPTVSEDDFQDDRIRGIN